MSILKSLAVFLLSSLFIISLYLTISSYTIGDLIQKESIKGFVRVQLEGEMMSKNCEGVCSSDFSIQKCEEYCDHLDADSRQPCKDACRSNETKNEAKQSCIQRCSSGSNESQVFAYQTIDEIYGRKMIDDISLDDVAPIFKNTIIFLVLSIILGISTFLVAEKPLSKLGNNLIVVSISLLSLAVIPVFIITPDIPVVKIIFDYVSEGLQRQLILGIVILVIGIVLIVIGKKKNR